MELVEDQVKKSKSHQEECFVFCSGLVLFCFVLVLFCSGLVFFFSFFLFF